MIEASFGTDRSAMASGAYQYDTGQRLRMHGLPSPEELACTDAFLSGEMITMQVHFGWKGDSQTQARLALWEETSQCWVAMIPDEYLQAAENVHAYVYVSYGEDAEGNGRTKTMYELVFRPIERPAPNNVVTGEQWEAWATKKTEMQLTQEALETARKKGEKAQENAELAAEQTKEAARQAEEGRAAAAAQLQRMESIQAMWASMDVRVVPLEAGMPAQVNMDAGTLTYGLPEGMVGEKGETGDTGPADIALSIADGILTITPRE